MDSLYLNTSDADTHNPSSSTSSLPASVSSPTASVFSRGHVSRGSGSSIASSPIPRDSFDMYAGKRLEDVTEEPQEKDEFEGYTLVDDLPLDLPEPTPSTTNTFAKRQPSPPRSPVDSHCGFTDPDDSQSAYLSYPQSKRPRSLDQPSATLNRFSGRFGSLSRRWRNRSAAGPQLSIVTHMHAPASRSDPLSNTQILSPALSVISKHDSFVASSPILPMASETSLLLESEPIPIDTDPAQENHEPGQATTPLLPPMFSELYKNEDPVYSPLQSPSIAPASASAIISSQTSFDTSLPHLPSPPLSNRPSMVSMHNRSRANTATSPYGDLPPIQLLDETTDPWDIKLGHANFTIHPEPYVPEVTDLDSYVEFRSNWDQARTNYVKHIARTAEHYGTTSKVYRLTEEKWNSVDAAWKRQYAVMQKALAPTLARLSDSDSERPDSTTSSAILEKPLTRVVVPRIDDKSGKFPELGDGEIVGPMAVGPPRMMEQRSPPVSPHRRNLSKIIASLFRG